MSETRTRRDFMKATTVAVAIAETARPALTQPRSTGGRIAIRQSTTARKYAEEAPLEWRPATASDPAAIILDPSRTYQEMLGFGAAFTDAACYTMNELPSNARQQLLHDLFHPAAMNLSVCRTCMGSSDYSTKVYSYDEGDPDPEMKRFSIEHDRSGILPILRQARAINPELFLLASPWSPPGWMKANGSMLGGSMRKHWFAAYATYFVKFLQSYAAEGAAINAVTSQNEVDTDQDGKMPASLLGQEYEIEFIARHLGPALARNNLAAKIWILDHNYNLWGRAICTLDEPEVSRYVDGVAWHGYAGEPSAMTRVHEAHPDKHAYWTEGGPDYTDPQYATDWTKWSTTYAAILRNQARCIIGWNLALNEIGKPNIGPFPCGGLVTIHSQTHEITYSGQYHAFAHYSRSVHRGARRFDSAGGPAGVSHVGFTNPDGGSVLILTNPGAEASVRVELAGMMTDVALPADSITTLTWS